MRSIVSNDGIGSFVVPFLIGNAFCSKYEYIQKDIRHTKGKFATGEKNPAQKIDWDRNESNMDLGINKHFPHCM